jgi:nucleotide-binding universal stress UspA family protein
MDGSEMSIRALEYALDVHADAEITVLFVAGEPSPMMGKALNLALETDVEEAAADLAEEVFETARELAAERDADISTEVDLGDPAKRIVQHASNFDAVVVGSHGSDLRSTLFMGNVARRVSSRAPVPVTIVR